MKLFELYQKNTQQGTDNLKLISEAVDNKSGTVIKADNTPIKLGINSSKYILGLYETAVANGTSEQFLENLANLKTNVIMENDNTMRHIVGKYKHEVKNFLAGDDLDSDLYEALFDYYSDHGEMPYGVVKARDGDPFEWVTMRFDRDVRDYTGNDDVDVPALPSATMPSMARSESMYESKKTKPVAENSWAAMQQMVAARADKEKQEKGTGKFDKKSTSTGTVYSRKYNQDSGQSIETGRDAEGKTKEKRSIGRPSVSASASEQGTLFSDYSAWYHKSKRSNVERKISGGRPGALAVVPKGKKYLVIGKWEGESGTLFSNPTELVTADELLAYKSGRGRPKKVREWIETLRFVAEGKKEITGLHGKM